MTTVKIECLGYSIVADWHEGQTTDEIVFFLMGSTTSRKRQEYLTTAVVQNTGMSALSIDYSGHGESPFDLDAIRPAQHLLEIVTAYDWIKSQYPHAKVSIISGSYGAYLASYLIAYRSIEKLVLRVPAIYKPEGLYDLWGGRLNNEEKYRSEIETYRHDASALASHPIFQNARDFKGKCLVVVHSDDELIPSEVTDTYIEAFSAEKYVAEGFKHSITQSNPDNAELTSYQVAISDWLNKV